jgi:oligopeptidase B
MKRYAFSTTLFLIACSTTNNMQQDQSGSVQPPKAKVLEHKIITHNDTLIDNYFWMRLSDEEKNAKKPNQHTKDVLDYLNAENEYLDKKMKHTEQLQTAIYEEIIARIKQDDESVPVTINGYSYYSRFEEGQDYPFYCGKVVGSETEEIMLNGPEMGKNKSYFAIGDYTVSENNEILAYSVDYVSRRQYTIFLKNLKTGEVYQDKIENSNGGITWANDNKTIFYTKMDPVTLRSNQIYSHVIGTKSSADKLVFEEKDETFSCFIYKTKSRKYLMIGSTQTLSSEYRFLDANNPDGQWKIVQPRQRDLEYSIDHYGDDFYITTNYQAKNFRLVKTPVAITEKENWVEVIPHRSNVLLESIDIFQKHLVVTERKNGLTHLRVIDWADKSEHYIEFSDPAYLTYTFDNPEFNTDEIRIGYTSLTTPNTVYDYNMVTKKRETKKQQQVLGGKFDASNYTSERIYATSRDGVQIPISIVYKKGFNKDGNAPLLLYAYGSYGYSMDPTFSSVRLSLLDRGFAFAIAHIRGGQEMGREWYENGKLLNKKNTFYDFIDCGKHLVAQKYTSSAHLYAQGGSAGGLLMGAVVNMEPSLWNGVIAQVPFVDAVATMLDETIPLTTGEFDEWGNPKVKEYYDYIKSYSPYDNVKAQNYPNLLITTGYWDSQVQYWEPAKWIAKLRTLKTDDKLLLMRCNLDVGHGGASGRFQRYKEIAMEYTFLLDLEGIKE